MSNSVAPPLAKCHPISALHYTLRPRAAEIPDDSGMSYRY
jgi:hypothetical protein